ncbi:septum site-determining protein Ssd [Streptomyces sp. NPDC058045]|uniref:septum site-determining protein Ssd n=1 Tax=Streptomyces sp. NPDC058045 TaxID=3346311 RepID=UPI0036E7CFF9
MAGTTTDPTPGATDRRHPGPLLVTEDPELLDDLLRLCAAAGARPEVHHGVPARRGGWESAPLVIVGTDAAPRLRGAPRRRGVVLAGRDPDDHAVWRRAVEIGAEHVLVLPDGEQWLVDRIADVAEGAGRPAFTIGVLGGCGGAGASTLACALAVTAARSGRRTLLVDADPLGGGLDVLLGGESVRGLRWPDLAGARGRVASGALEESLPRMHSLRLLSWHRGERLTVAPEAMRAVLSAARRGGGAVVLDLPRSMDEGTAEALTQIDLGLVVVPARLRAAAAARQVASAAGLLLRDLRVVVAAPHGRGARPELPAADVARLLSLPPVGEVPTDPGLAAAPENGPPPGGEPKSPLARFCGTLWDRLPADGDPR